MAKLLVSLLFIYSFTLFGQSILTNGEVYDFEIGDEFEYSFNNYPGTFVERIVVLYKYFTQNNDSIFYSQSVSSYSNGPDGNGGTSHYYTEDTISFFVTDLNHPATRFGDSIYIYDDMLDSNYYYFPDTIIEFDSNLCNIEVNGWDSYPQIFESNQRIRIVGRGVGLVWTYHFDPSSPFPNLEDRKLYYFKKGNIKCGTPNTLATSTELLTPEISIYPNPSNSIVNIKSAKIKLYSDFQLFDINGTQISVELFRVKGNIYSFKTENIPNGLYFINISANDSSIKRKIVIAH